MKRSVLIVLLLTLAVPCLAFGHAQTAPPKPGPEVQRIGYFAGTWNWKGANETTTVSCEWFAGGYSLVCRQETTGATGKFTGLRVMTYDPSGKVYTHYMVTSMGPGGGMATGTVSGTTWLWQWDETASGKPAKHRLTIVEVSPTSYTSKYERSIAGGAWAVIDETTATRVK
jgi:hypothetical protein